MIGINAQAQTQASKVIGEIGDPILTVDELEDGGTYLITSVGRHNTDGQYLYESADHIFLFESVAEGHDANAAITIEVIDDSHIYIKSNTGYYIPPYADPRGRFTLSNVEKEPLLIEAIEGSDGQFTLAYTSYTGGSSAYGDASVIYLDADAANLSNWSSKSDANGNGAFRIVPVTLAEPTAAMYLNEVLAKHNFDASQYLADVPGGYPQELIDNCDEAYNIAVDIQMEPDVYTDEEIYEAANNLIAAYEALLAAQIKVTFEPGNYYLVSARVGTTNEMMSNVDDLTAVDAAYGATAGALWDVNFDATVTGAAALPEYIWQVESAGTTEEGEATYTIKNLAMGQYLNNTTGSSAAYGFVESKEDAGVFTVGTSSVVPGFITFMNTAITTSEHKGLHAATAGKKIVNWTPAGGASAWHVVAVDDETIAAMAGKIDSLRAAAVQQALNDTLQKYYDAASAARESGRTWIFDGTNDGQFVVGDGLLIDESQVWVNPADPSENNIPGLFDGEFAGSSFIHTSWHPSVKGTEPHYIQMDLGEEVQTLVLKYAVRRDAATPDIPYIVTVYGTNDPALTAHSEAEGIEGEDDYVPGDTVPSSEWTNLGDYTMQWQYPLLDSEGNAVNVSMRGNIRSVISTGEGSGVTTFELPAAYRYIRLAVKESVQSKKAGAPRTNGDGFSYWCLSELRAYAGEYDPDCVYAHMDEDAINALENSLAAAKNELADEKATQETIDALKAAYDAFMSVYPDKNKLQAAIDEAKTWMETAVEGDEIGNYESGAIAELEGVINDAQTVADGTLTFSAYNDAMTSLADALKAFAAKLVLPETGYYNIQSITTGAGKENFLYAASTSTSSVNAASGLRWGLKDEPLNERVNALWYVEKLDNGKYTFFNVGSGYYMQNTQDKLSNSIAQGTEPCEIGLAAARDSMGIGLNIVINEENGLYANAQPGGKMFVVWNAAKGNDNSAWTFLSADTEATLLIDIVKPVSIHVLPFDILTPENGVYEVAGLTDGGTKLGLNQITTPQIAAGTPFVVVVDPSTTPTLPIFLVEENFENIVYVRDAKTVNGLVGVFEPDTISDQCLVMNTACTELVYASNASYQAVPANAGYFVWADLQELPEVASADETIDLMEALVNGIGALVAEPAAATRQGVYTIQGQKINDVRNLPAGVYIVNGRKVLVK